MNRIRHLASLACVAALCACGAGSGDVSVPVGHRPLSQALTARSRAPIDVAFVDGEAEAAELAERFNVEAATLDGNITVPVSVTLTGASASGDEVRSNALVYPVTICATCSEYVITPYALGSTLR
jgi:hypothetical protein